jgi:hypothetical protein
MRFAIVAILLFVVHVCLGFGFVPGACGTYCMSQAAYWGPAQYHPPVYLAPYQMRPGFSFANFYANPYSYWPMLPRWNHPVDPVYNINRGIAEENKNKPEKK